MFLLAHLPQTYQTSSLHPFRERQLELFVRITRFFFGEESWMGHPEQTYRLEESMLSHPFYPRKLFVPPSLRCLRELEMLPRDISSCKLCYISVIAASTHSLVHLFETVLREQIVSIFSSYVMTTIEAADRELRTCHTEEVLGAFMHIIYSITLSSLRETTRSDNASLLSRLTSIVVQMDGHISRLKPKTRILSYSGKCYVSQFSPKDWLYMTRSAPAFAIAFKSLVHNLRLYDLKFGNTTFHSFQGITYTSQWRRLVREVLSGVGAPLGTHTTPHVFLDVQGAGE